MTRQIIEKLHSVAVQAIEYVGSANYPERERAALSAMTRATNAALRGDENNVVFSIPEED